MTAPQIDLTTDAGRKALTLLRHGHPEACPERSVHRFAAIQARLRRPSPSLSTRSRDMKWATR